MDGSEGITQQRDKIGRIAKPQETVKVDKNERMELDHEKLNTAAGISRLQETERMKEDPDHEQECKTDGIAIPLDYEQVGKIERIPQVLDQKDKEQIEEMQKSPDKVQVKKSGGISKTPCKEEEGNIRRIHQGRDIEEVDKTGEINDQPPGHGQIGQTEEIFKPKRHEEKEVAKGWCINF